MTAAPEAMLLEKREDPFDDERFIFEPKIDGHRLLMTKHNDHIKLFTRHGNDVTIQYPELHNMPINCTSAILDGEVAYMHPETGMIDFELVMERFKTSKASKIKEGMLRLPVRFFVFDVLSVNNQDLRRKPLMQRKEILDDILMENDFYKRVIHVDGCGNDLFKIVQQRQLEGIVAKKKDSHYVGHRSDKWLKVINYTYAEVQIAGYRKDKFGWLAHYKGRPVGLIELAVPATHKQAFYTIAQSIVTGEDRNFVYVQPTIKANVRFRNWYKSGMLRSPEFVNFM